MNESAKRIYDVQIAGLPLKLRSSHDEETVSELINLVEHKVQEAMGVNSSASFQNALILASLNIAEELLLLKKTAVAELNSVEERARLILDQIEEVSSPVS